MAHSTVTTSAGWPASPHFTADGETGLAIPNPYVGNLAFVTTDDDTQPDGETARAIPIKPGEVAYPTLKSGERLWLAYPSLRDGTALVDIHY